MTVQTNKLILASISITAYELARTPIYTLFLWVKVKLWLPSKILPVMSIDTGVSLVFAFIVWAPNRLKVKHVKIKVLLKLVNKFNWYFSFRVCKWTEVSIFTLTCTINIWWTEFCFVFIWVIKFFNSVMCFLTTVTWWAFFSLCRIITHLRLVGT